MKQYIIRRLLQMIPIIIGVSLIIFIIFKLPPGDAVDNMRANHPKWTDEKVAQLKHVYHLDRSWIVQYGYWAADAVRGNLGDSYQYKQPVSQVIWHPLWNSFSLSILAFILEYLIAIPIGIVSATKQYSFVDMFFTVFALVGISIPSFFFGLLLQKWFCVDTRIFPVSGMHNAGVTLTGISNFIDWLYHAALPLIVLTFTSVAGTMRYMRTSMLEVVRQDYIRTARAKGLKEKTVIYKHALRNAMIPIVTLMGLSLPALFQGAMLTEQIFSWPGIGKLTLFAVFNRDYPLLMGTTMLTAILTLIGNLVADVTYAMVDPRIRLS